jgi:XTP/dITP diphosphohydrolase
MSEESRKILVATTNPGKIAEIRAMLGDDWEWLGLAELGAMAEIREDGATFAENARKKALGYARAAGLWTVADDSGLVVDALGGAPGVKSARFSGEKPQGADRRLIDRRNMAKVMELLKGVPEAKRTARFVCCLCLASPEKVLLETEGRLEGLITDRQIGENGFGYDPIFFVPRLGKTVAQLTREQKNTLSHRGNALRKLRPLLDELLQAGRS